MRTPKGTQGIDWQGIGALLGLIAFNLALAALFASACFVLAHFILKYW